MKVLTIGELKRQISGLPDELEVYVRTNIKCTGNIENAGVAAKSELSSFGNIEPCVIIEPMDWGG